MRAIQNPQYPRSKYHTQLAEVSFDEIFDLSQLLFFYFIKYFPLYMVHDIFVYLLNVRTRRKPD